MVSVLMPVYNGEQYLGTAIESILSQTQTSLEFIIIDDGSSDRTADIISSYYDDRIVCHRQANRGVALSLNTGVRIARASIIARMDADDVAVPERLSKQLRVLEEHDDVVVVGSGANVIDENGEFVYRRMVRTTDTHLRQILPKSPFIHPSVMFRKDAFLSVGGYPNIPVAQDVVLFNRLAKCGKLANIGEPLISYRLRPNSVSAREPSLQRLCRAIVDEALTTGDARDSTIAAFCALRDEISFRDKEFYYRVLLAKKYLWNNYSPKRARRHLIAAIQTKRLNVLPYVLYVLSALPGAAIRGGYELLSGRER